MPGTESMHINYTLTRDDFITYIKYLHRRIGRSAKFSVWIRLTILAVLVGLFILIEEFAKHGLGFGVSAPERITIALGLVFLLVAGAMVAYWWLYARKASQVMISDDSPFLVPGIRLAQDTR